MVQIRIAPRFLSALLIAAGTAGALALPQASAAAVGVYVQLAPPAPRAEYVPPPRHGYVWAPGYWNWRGHRHVWVGGTWAKHRHGYHYQPHGWVERNGGWYLERGRWDRDGDGIPDGFDRHPRNPYRP